MRSSALLSGLRPHPKTLYKGEAARGTIPVTPPNPGASRMPQTLRVPQSVLLFASFFHKNKVCPLAGCLLREATRACQTLTSKTDRFAVTHLFYKTYRLTPLRSGTLPEACHIAADVFSWPPPNARGIAAARNPMMHVECCRGGSHLPLPSAYTAASASGLRIL